MAINNNLSGWDREVYPYFYPPAEETDSAIDSVQQPIARYTAPSLQEIILELTKAVQKLTQVIDLNNKSQRRMPDGRIPKIDKQSGESNEL